MAEHQANIIDGRHHARKLESRVAAAATDLKTNHGITPTLGVILVEGNPASEIYVRKKRQKAESLGIKSIVKTLPPDTALSAIESQITAWNSDDSIHGILLQLPLPGRQDPYDLLQTIAPAKDVDALHALNAGKLFWQQTRQPMPCTPTGCLILLESAVKKFDGLHAVVVGASPLVGRPMAQLLLQKNCTVSIAHSKTKDLPALTRQADILVVATGNADLIRGDMIKPGATVIDVGINRLADGRITGDVCFEEAERIAGAITPVPGGVGPMTIACLMANTVTAAFHAHALELESLFKSADN
ncbi:MAG: bifunctional methylenetetrahydrofolate dehydrogenase/methenyltetrahydrofolate cyclohydrolase [Alphaproteobacteria bacterium]|nr:MAG: bifunctional methylenetetrahydrofolate dehydrogenase/methenyltetrahydrofolate cyclohydrolase [Alphaproteobacteria bacterium]